MFNIFRKRDNSLIDAATLQQILGEILSPKLGQLGLTRQANYLWYDSTVDHIRRGFSYSLLKGGQATFTWGVNLDFLPIVSNGKIVYHKSAKNYVHHLFEWTDEYRSSFLGKELAGGVTTHFGAHNARKSIATLFKRYESSIVNWFNTASSISELVSIAERQVADGKHYKFHDPHPAYVLAFLNAKANRLDQAAGLFDNLDDYYFDNNAELRIKLKENLLALAGAKN